MLSPGTQRQTPTQAVHTVAKQQETQAHIGKRGGVGGLVVEELVEGEGGVVCIKTHLTLGYTAACVVIKRFCQQESGGSHAGGGMTQCAPTLLFHRQWRRKKKKTKR